jgi:hypothetical protein
VSLFALQAIVTVTLVTLWWHGRRPPRPQPPPPPTTPTAAPTKATTKAATKRPPEHLDLRVVFVDERDGGVLLDCVLTAPYGTAEPGSVFRMAVAVPWLLMAPLSALFERWANEDTDVHLVLHQGARGAARASFEAGPTRLDLELVASSPLRAA